MFKGTTTFAYLAYTTNHFWVHLYAAPIPRDPLKSEKVYWTILPSGNISDAKALPCWQDKYDAQKKTAHRKGNFLEKADVIEEAEIYISLVVPAYNEEDRLGGMLEEAVEYLCREYGGAYSSLEGESQPPNGTSAHKTLTSRKKLSNGSTGGIAREPAPKGWEILIVSDGSTDKTNEIALSIAKYHQLSQYPLPSPGTHKSHIDQSGQIPHGSIRVVTLKENRGKGGAVTHGFRHVRGKYAVFADADGASKFQDLGKLVRECQAIEDEKGRGVAVGSRAHLVGSKAVVQRSFLRNFLMHSFHVLLRLLTTPATSAIKDTQCGFKLFSRPSLPYIIPYMHSEGWIFDVEMLMLAESAGIPVAEVPVGWREIKGSKLNVIWDSLGMAWGLAVLRAAWAFGVYRR
ncbi:MAG: dolichyl-phosphate beta-glucosyltransferase [Candelina mexicana]|nr:MAG: dolichyl-phosphate beta-glucosyltransferase [Candelina mexicana]